MNFFQEIILRIYLFSKLELCSWRRQGVKVKIKSMEERLLFITTRTDLLIFSPTCKTPRFTLRSFWSATSTCKNERKIDYFIIRLKKTSERAKKTYHAGSIIRKFHGERDREKWIIETWCFLLFSVCCIYKTLDKI